MDWWALGILIYEMLIGVTPFFNKERKLLLVKIKNSKVVFPDKRRYKIEYSEEFVDLVLRLLHKEKDKRLGTQGDVKEVLEHPFFASLNLDAVLNKTMEPPLKINLDEKNGAVDTRYFNSKSSVQDLAETVLPQAKLDTLKKNEGKFSNFDS